MNSITKIPQKDVAEIQYISTLPDQCRAMVVSNHEELQAAADILSDTKSKIRKLEESRKKITRPLDEAKKETMAFYQPAVESLKEIERIIKSKVSEYNRKVEADRARELAEAEEKARKVREKLEAKAEKAVEAGKIEKAGALLMQAETTVAEVPAIVDKKISGLTIRKTMVGEVYDKIALCKAISEGIIPDILVECKQSEINKLATLWGEKRDFAGIRFYEKQTVASR